jgi:hypothetical protein
MYKCKYFQIEELVSKAVLDKYGELAWSFIDVRLLKTLDFLREQLDRSITINNWKWGGRLSQRCLRENTCEIVRKKTSLNQIYISGHVQGIAADFDVKGMTSVEVRLWIIENQESLPYPVRLEGEVSWIHIDMRETNNQVYIFNP